MEESEAFQNGKFILADGSERFLITQKYVDDLEKLGFSQLEN